MAFTIALLLLSLNSYINISFGLDPLSCDTDGAGYSCHGTSQCTTFALLRTNPLYSSLSNFSFYLGLTPSILASPNGLSPKTNLLPLNRPIIIPISCNCHNGFFGAEVTKTGVGGESFYDIAKSMEGLTTCKAIRDNNPLVSPLGVADGVKIRVPLRCACDATSDQLLLSYPVAQGDTVRKLALSFKTTPERILGVNNGTGRDGEVLAPNTCLLIPVKRGWVLSRRKKKRATWKLGVYVAVAGMVVAVVVAVSVLLLMKSKSKRKEQRSLKASDDVELQQLSLSVRTTGDKKVSFEGSSQDRIDRDVKTLLEVYTIEELETATEGFSCGNHIDGPVFHGRISGKNLAVKRIHPQIVPDIDLELFQDALHHHPNIMRIVGTCFGQESSFLVFEYAKNGSLRDWLHGGLAVKNQFIASCYCFLTWSQRLKICLDVAMALHYMHSIMNPPYVHRNVKSRNIFLDEEFNAKIGNFGMARCADQQTLEDPTTNPASWSLGYLAPEVTLNSPSIDIYAFGIVLLEVLSGKTPITRANEKGEGRVCLSQKIKEIVESENAEKLREWIDSALGEGYSFEGAVAVANLGRACTEEEASLRPSAGEVVEKLSRLVQELPQGDMSVVSESSSKPLVKAGDNSCE